MRDPYIIFQCFGAHCILTQLACPHKYKHRNTHICSAVSSRTQYTLCLQRCSLTSGISRVTHENGLQRERTHGIWLSGESVPEACALTVQRQFSSPFLFLHYITLQHTCSVEQFNSVWKNTSNCFTTLLLCYILKKTLIYPTSFFIFTTFQLKVLICT